MPIEPVAYVAVAVCIFLLGFVTREIARWARLEAAFSRVTRGQLDEFVARFREETGQAFGVIEEVPAAMSTPWWTELRSAPVDDSDVESVPDDEREVDVDDDGYPRNLRVAEGAARLLFEPRGDADQSGWYVNPAYPELATDVRAGPGAHRAEPEPEEHQTRDLSAFVGVAAPPGVVA